MTADEIALLERFHKQGKTVEEVLAKLQADRAKEGETVPSKTAVYRFLEGKTYERGRSETRGAKRIRRPSNLPSTANKQRIKLIKEAKNDYLVTWSDVHQATKTVLKKRGAIDRTHKMPSQDWLEREMRDNYDVRARPGKRRISRATDQEKQRYDQALDWVQHSKGFWTNGIHAYIDNKKFVMARTAVDKKKLRSTRVHHHLWTPGEGGQKGFVLPKKGRMLLGIPSVDVTCAVCKGKIILWHVNSEWNGAAAARMYKDA